MSQPHNQQTPATEVTVFQGLDIHSPSNFLLVWVGPDGTVQGRVNITSPNLAVHRELTNHALSALSIIGDNLKQNAPTLQPRDIAVQRAVASVLVMEEMKA